MPIFIIFLIQKKLDICEDIKFLHKYIIIFYRHSDISKCNV